MNNDLLNFRATQFQVQVKTLNQYQSIVNKLVLKTL